MIAWTPRNDLEVPGFWLFLFRPGHAHREHAAKGQPRRQGTSAESVVLLVSLNP